MNYITNKDLVSARALYGPAYLSHGLISWAKHRYVKREGSKGNYKYIYPEDLASRRASRNERGATLFGDKRLRTSARASAAQARRLEKATKRAERKATRLEAKAIKASIRLNDPSLSEKQKKRLSKKATNQRVQAEVAKRLVQKLSEATLTEQERARTNKFYYDRSRKIDDIPKNILEFGAAYFNAARRNIRAKSKNNSMQKRDQRAAQGRQNKPFNGLLREQKIRETIIPEKKIRERKIREQTK